MANNMLKVFATCPPSYTADPRSYQAQVAEVARWSEEAGCEGTLVYTDNAIVDPWLVAQTIVLATTRLCPLVAVQPVYLHPFAVAKMVASLGFLHGRRVYLNMVAGGYKGDLNALNDPTPHDERYARLIEYTQLILLLLRGGPVTFEGRYYRVTNAKLGPPFPPELMPGVFVSGSSAAGVAAAKALGGTAVQYPRPAAEYEASGPVGVDESGVRVGIVTRADGEEAWEVARSRFPEDRKGQLTRQLATKVSDSEWHHQLAGTQTGGASSTDPYWLVPFENYKTNCPYLVGSHQRVAAEIARYVGVGYRSFILDVPASQEELGHVRRVFDLAGAALAS
jgi:alkanesulfonate monooxygenase